MARPKTQTDPAREKQVRDAEELLFTGPQKLGLAKGLFLGRFVADWVMPYPTIAAEQSESVEQAVAGVRTTWPPSLSRNQRPGPTPPPSKPRPGPPPMVPITSSTVRSATSPTAPSPRSLPSWRELLFPAKARRR